MTADLAPGVIVEMYRGRCFEPPFIKGARFVVSRAWQSDLGPCTECLPGYDAPAIEIEGWSPPPGRNPLCSCCFRPVREGGEPQSIAREVQARERAPAGV